MNIRTEFSEHLPKRLLGFLTLEDIAACGLVEGPGVPLVREIVKNVAQATNIPESAIYSINRVPSVARARQIVMYVAAREGVAAAMIGRVLGRDHTTVMHGIRAEKARRGEL